MASVLHSMHSGAGQTILMGCLFFFVFMAYFMIQGFSATLYGPQLGADMEATLYLSFTFACFVAPSIVNKIGCRLGMFLGILGYASLVAASLFYFILTDGTSNPTNSPYAWVVVSGGAVLGVGAALLWTAQGRLILEYGGDGGADSGRLWAIFWGIFNLSAVAGGIMTATYFASPGNAGNTGSVGLYMIFLSLILTGAFGTFLLQNPEDIARSHTVSAQLDPEADMLLPTPGVSAQSSESVQTFSWSAEAKGTLQLFATRRYLILAPIYFYTGFNQPYQLVVVGTRSFTPAVLGLELALFYVAEIIGGFVAGWMLDKSAAGGSGRQRAASTCMRIFAVLMAAGYVLALLHEWTLAGTAVPSFFGGNGMFAASVMMVLWGFSDSQIQTYVMWDIGIMHAGDGQTQARAVGFYKMVQSAGWSFGFALSPVTRLAPMYQWVATFCVGIVGVLLVFFELQETKMKGNMFTGRASEGKQVD